MKYLSLVAVAALLAYTTSAIAQDVSASVSASASVGDTSSAVSSALSSASSDVSSALSSASSELSSASSEVGGGLSSASSAASSLAGVSCDTLNTQTIATTAIDPSVLAAITSVQIFALTNCAGMSDLATIDAGAAATIGATPAVASALQAAGETGADIAGYTVEGTTLVVYVKHRA